MSYKRIPLNPDGRSALADCCESCDHGSMGYIATGGASIGPEGGLLAPSTQEYQREGAPGRLALQTEIYTLGYDDPEFARRSQQLNVKGGQDWLLDADRRYHTSLEGFIDDNKSNQRNPSVKTGAPMKKKLTPVTLLISLIALAGCTGGGRNRSFRVW